MLGNNKKKSLLLCILLGSTNVTALNAYTIEDDTTEATSQETSKDGGEDGIVVYKPEFFDQYFPVTALDMVNRVPGFAIDRGGDVRGFGGAAGNVLIDGKRPSTKSDNIEDLLSRISKGSVERVELIRGATGGLDLGGQQTVAVNVVRKDDAGGAIPWELSFLGSRAGFVPRLNVAYSNEINRTSYTIGLEGRQFIFQERGDENLINFAGPNELREEVEDGRFRRLSLDIKTETGFDNGDIFRLNFRTNRRGFDGEENSDRTPENQGSSDLFLQIRDNSNNDFEVSSDYEHDFSENFAIKVIGLINRQFRENLSTLDIDRAIGEDTINQSISDTTEGETIGRLEFDWNGWKNHTIQFGGEIAQNFVDSDFQLFNNGEEIPLPGSNTRVSELRGEPFISDSWSLNSKLTADLSLAVEISRIQQTGDVENSRTFVFPKPRLSFTYVPTSQSQWRLRLEQEVGQLNFFDFVSSANFDDADLDFGNPDLQPDRTLVAEAAYERRFGEIGVVSLTVFYNYVQDLIDLIPTSATTEATGNIGNGTRYGVEVGFTTPFDFIGLSDARVDVNYRIQGSSVTDLVTGESRRFSNERPQSIEIDFRKELPGLRSATGFRYFDRNDSQFFGVDEFVVQENNDTRFSMFWETTLPAGIKVRGEVNNLFNTNESRVRTVFNGSRSLSDVLFIEDQLRTQGTEFFLTVSGVF
ncbi:TonB-dependent siderophore receptor [Kordiimonas sp. SCSIO 12610]|uniref:TonB-dependent receptor plug domain-containing protein n=1 Tax=Kordiimonas sp. SCSIO 12610 TaxID=2829597 RepID=UPI00210CA727|nr:outer membrane beta-barrel protein [Kordiimonas sp. SCSIO 12610]UTW55760.1 outer membrane beta-barrel protein [Kordiimonas sp. SCSIO 12610]